jgi:hypothetical protein
MDALDELPLQAQESSFAKGAEKKPNNPNRWQIAQDASLNDSLNAKRS